jgi:hypothetical protein
MKVAMHVVRGGVVSVVLMLGGYVGLATAGIGADGGFDADMLIHFPGFFRAPRAASTNNFVSIPIDIHTPFCSV